MVARNDQNSVLVAREGGLQAVVSAMKAFPASVLMQKNAAFALAAVAAKCTDSIRETILREGGITKMLAAMRDFPTAELLQKYGAIAVANVAQCSNAELRSRMGQEAVPVILSALRKLPDSQGMQAEGWRGIAKIVQKQPEMATLCLRLGTLQLAVATLRTNPTPLVHMRACIALSKMIGASAEVAAAAPEELVGVVIANMLAMAADDQVRKVSCQALVGLSARKAEVSALFKAAIPAPGATSDNQILASLAAIAALAKDNPRNCEEFLQVGVARLLADTLSTSQRREVLGAACNATSALAAIGDSASPTLVPLAVTIEAAVSRCKLSNDAREALAVIRRSQDPAVAQATSKGFCTATVATPDSLRFYSSCPGCPGRLFCSTCITKCHASHALPSAADKPSRMFGTYQCDCAAGTCCCKHAAVVIEHEGRNVHARMPFGATPASTVLLAACTAVAFAGDTTKQAVEYYEEESSAFVPLISLDSAVVSSSKPLRLRIVQANQ
jgi:hypothetical protein